MHLTLTDKFYKRILMLCLSGILTGLTVTFPKIGILGFITLIPLALFLLSVASDKEVKLRALYGYGFSFFTSFYLVCFHWFINLYPLEFIDGMTRGSAVVVVLFATVGLSIFQAVQSALIFPLMGLLFRSRAVRDWLKPLIIAAFWAVYEWTQTFGTLAFPWSRLAIGQSSLTVGLQTASLFGSYFISFLVVLVNSYIAYAILLSVTEKGKARTAAIRLSTIICASALLIQYGGGLCIWLTSAPNEDTDTVTVAVIQGNIPSGEKWSAETAERTLAVYEKYTAKASNDGASIVVFPETALPWTVKEGNSRYAYLSDLSTTYEVTILAGALTVEGDKEYNSIVCFTPDGEMSDTIYNKRHLVPFGEFVPLKGLIKALVPPLADLILSGGEISEGEGANIFELDEGSIGSIICFDSVFEELTLQSVREGAELICLSTNDSWFTDSAALYMHNAQAQLRAIECGRYVARAANTGISTMINHRGEVTDELAPLVDGMIVKEVELRSGRTLYSYIGNLFVYICIAFIIILFLTKLFTLHKKYE